MAHSVAPEEALPERSIVKLQNSGVSGTVLDDLSGTYKTFVESVKELISNSYDADAQKVELRFTGDFEALEVEDNGAGMNPKQFVREYIRVGRSPDAVRWSPSRKRERIGGKGIGSLSPARYCKRLMIRTKSKEPLYDFTEVMVPEDGRVRLEEVFPYLILSDNHVNLFDYLEYQVIDGENDTPAAALRIEVSQVLHLPPGRLCRVAYSFAAERVWLLARIDFVGLRHLGEQFNLEQVAELWTVNLIDAVPEEYGVSRTTLVLEQLEDFVTNDLRAPGKLGARNISSKSGIDRFIWTLSRLCPVPVSAKGELTSKFPDEVAEILLNGPDFQVYLSYPGLRLQYKRLERELYLPHRPVADQDAALCRIVRFEDESCGLAVRGYVLASSTTIYPAELRGISLRVKGVELGAPTLFGADNLVTGPQHAALTSHLTGELHLVGVDARRDILPGREGLYPESPVFRALRRVLVGTEDRLGGVLQGLVAEILLRSEAQGSAQGLVKKLGLQRRALLDAASSISTMTETDDLVWDRLMNPPEEEPRLLMYPQVVLRPEGRLKTFKVDYKELPRGINFDIDYTHRILWLPEGAEYLKKKVDIGQSFEAIFVEAAGERVFSEVDPSENRIYINWAHSVRGSMGDAAYIKHCLAAIVCGLDQDALNRYVSLLLSR